MKNGRYIKQFQMTNYMEIDDMEKIKKNEKLILWGIIIVHTIALFILNNYPKSIAGYGDELLYFDLAKSINAGQGLRIRGAEILFTNALYPMMISPFFYIKNTLLRYKAICLFNAFFMSLSSLPIYYISEEIGLSKKNKWIVIFIMCFWPEMILSTMCLCENKYFTLSLVAILYCVRVIKYGRLLDVVKAGISSWMACFAKEVGLCLVVALVISEIIIPIFFRNNEKIFEILKRVIIVCIVYALIIFGLRTVCYHLIINTNHSFYSSSLVISTYSEAKDYLYALYSFLYYLAGALLAFLIVPMILPILRFDSYSEENRKIILFSWILFLVSAFVVVVKISLPLEYGARTPDVPIRYISQYMGLFLALSFADCTSKKEKSTILGVLFKIWAVILVLTIPLIFKQVYQDGYPITCTLQYVIGVNDILGNMHFVIAGWEFFASIIFITAVALSVLLIVFKSSQSKRCICIYVIYCILICVIDAGLAYKEMRWWCSVEPQLIEEMSIINEYLNSTEKGASICYLLNDSDLYGKRMKVYDTYLDTDGFEYASNKDSFFSEYEKNNKNLKELEASTFVEEQYRTGYSMNNLKYILVSDDTDIESMMPGAEKIKLNGVTQYTLFAL